MSKIPAILSTALTISLAACADDHKPIGQPITTPLVTTQKTTVGTVTVFNSTDGFFLTAAPDKGWQLTQTRLTVSLSPAALPHGHDGKPALDRFFLSKTKTNSAGEMAYALPLLVTPGTELFLALYAELRPLPASGNADDDQDHGDCDNHGHVTAWALGTPFPGKDGSMYFTYTVRDNAPVSLKGQYRTYTQDIWGAAPDGKNPATSLATNFPTYFPSGVTIGNSGGFTSLFTSAQAVADFLPQSGAPGPLTGSSVNPQDLGNPFAGDTLALTLNVRFDALDPSLSAGSVPFGSLVIAEPSNSFYGLSVQSVLGMANKVLCSPPGTLGGSEADLYAAVAKINANFDGGTADFGFLALP